MKLSKLYIIAAAFLLVGIIVFVAGFAMLDFDFSNFDTEPVYTPMKYTESGSISGIVIKDDGADIKFTQSSDKKIHIKYYENGVRTYEITKLEGDILSVELKNNADWKQKLNLSRSTPVITVMLPKKFRGDIRIESQKGDVEFDSVVAEGVTVTSSGGDIRMFGCTVSGNMTATAQSGNVELYNNKISGVAQFNSFRGNILAQLVTASEIYVDTTRGHVTLADVSSLGNIFGECDGGDIRLSALGAKQSITLIADGGSIRGSLTGHADDYAYNCNAQGGACNLPQNNLGGKKNLNLRTQNGDIDISIATK